MKEFGSVTVSAPERLIEDDLMPLLKTFFPKGDVKAEIVIFYEDEATAVVEVKNTGSFKTKRPDPSDGEACREFRKEILRTVYKILVNNGCDPLPWGILTGVRPTKFVLQRIEQGIGKSATFLMENYLVSKEKATLAVRIAASEYRLLENLDVHSGYSIYVGIPFCPSICNYCTFGSHPLARYGGCVEPYLESLMHEIRECSKFFPNRRLDCVYIGGGTPTSLSAPQMERLFKCLKENFDFSDVREFCVEAGRPDTITSDRLAVIKEAGANRISINPQSMVEKTLVTIGRNHSPSDVVRAFADARKAGFDNINMDLIAGLSGETPKDFDYTLSQITQFAPESLTIHTLAHKRAARLNTNPELYEGMEADGVAMMVEAGAKYAASCGLEPYYMYRQKNMSEGLENVGYAKPGKECLYNVLIMEEKEMILALGAGASSKFVRDCDGRFERVENVKSVRDYIDRIDEMIERKRDYIKKYGLDTIGKEQ